MNLARKFKRASELEKTDILWVNLESKTWTRYRLHYGSGNGVSVGYDYVDAHVGLFEIRRNLKNYKDSQGYGDRRNMILIPKVGKSL